MHKKSKYLILNFLWGECMAGCAAELGREKQGWRLSGMEQLGGWNGTAAANYAWGLANFTISQTDEKGYLLRR